MQCAKTVKTFDNSILPCLRKAGHKGGCNPFSGDAMDAEVKTYNFQYLTPSEKPVIAELERHEVVYAKDQPQYIPLRSLRGKNPAVPVLSRWTLTPEQRKMVADGADIFLELSTFGDPLQPIRLAVSDGPNPLYFQETYCLKND